MKQANFKIDTSGISQEAIAQLKRDIEYFDSTYGGRTGMQLTDDEVSEIFSRPVAEGMVDYGLMVVLGHDYVPTNRMVVPTDDSIEVWDADDERWETEFQAIMEIYDRVSK